MRGRYQPRRQALTRPGNAGHYGCRIQSARFRTDYVQPLLGLNKRMAIRRTGGSHSLAITALDLAVAYDQEAAVSYLLGNRMPAVAGGWPVMGTLT